MLGGDLALTRSYSRRWQVYVIGSEKTCHVANLLILQSAGSKKEKHFLGIFSKLSSLLSYYENLLP